MKIAFFSNRLNLLFCLLASLTVFACTKTSGLDGKKKIIRQSRIEKGKTMDPQAQFDEPSSWVVNRLFDGLYTYHYLKRPYELIPSIAAELPKLSSDELTMIVPLRRDVRFIDDACFAGGKGRLVNAHDVVYTMKRFADASVNDSSYGLIEGLIVGLDDFHKKTMGTSFGTFDYDSMDVPGMKALDEHTVQFKMTKPNTVLAYVFANGVTSIVPRECTEKYGEDFGTHPVGTGPFKIKYRNRLGDHLLVKNENYHMTYPTEGMPGDAEKGLLKHAGARLPLVDEVYSPVIAETQPTMLRFMRAYLDWVAMDADSFLRMGYQESPGVFKLKPEFADKFSIYSELDVGTFWFTFNMKDPLLGKNAKLRRAIALAINRQGFIDDMLNGRGMVVDSLVPTTIAGNHIDTNSSFPNFNLALAKKTLAEAGYPNGKGLPPFKFMNATAGTTLRQYEYFRRNLAEIGIQLEADFTTYSAFLKRMDDGNFQIGFPGWHADYPDAENFLFWLTGPARAAGQNYGNWQNKTYDALYKQIAGHPDSPHRRELIHQMNAEIAKDIPLVPIYSPIRVGMLTKWTSNFKRMLMADRQLQYLDVDAAAQKKGL